MIPMAKEECRSNIFNISRFFERQKNVDFDGLHLHHCYAWENMAQHNIISTGYE
jgi:hypothetical protein